LWLDYETDKRRFIIREQLVAFLGTLEEYYVDPFTWIKSGKALRFCFAFKPLEVATDTIQNRLISSCECLGDIQQVLG
jgi:hypothetical protein